MKISPTHLIKTWGVVSALALACMVAGAQTITLTNPGPNLGATNYVNNFSAGTAYNASWTGAVQVNDGASTFYAYCIDPKTGTQFGVANTYISSSLNNFLNTPAPTTTGYQQQFTGAGYNGATYGIQNTTLVQNSLTSLFSHAYSDSLTSSVKAAAFGFAVWEIMGESTYGRIAGALRSTGSDATANSDTLELQIDAYLSALSGNSWGAVNGANLTTATSYTYTVYYDPAAHTAQNFIRVTPGSGGGTSVPEPASLALVGLALVGATLSRRRTALA